MTTDSTRPRPRPAPPEAAAIARSERLRVGRGRTASRRARSAVLAVAVVLAGLLAPAVASAHAQLEGAVPAGGSVVRAAPGSVEFRFSEGVTATDDALRVTAPDGEQADTGAPFHPAGAPERIAVRLKGDLPQGSYTATYRVTSADGHPISNGVVFSIGRPSATATSLAGALEGQRSGPVTRTTFGVVRALQYLAIALAIGGLVFALLVLRPARALDPDAVRRTRRLVVPSALAGALTAALGVVLEGAEGAGTSLWSALRPGVVGDAFDTRFGTVWAIATACWLLVAVISWRLLRPAADRPGPSDRGTRLLAAALVLPALFVVAHPSLAGHAATQSPRGLLFVSITLHVAAMVVWVGGLAALLAVVLPGARGSSAPGPADPAPAGAGAPPSSAAPPGDRTAAVAGRFSRLAIWAVAGVALSGAVQGYVLVRTPEALLDTAHGRAVLIKTLLLVAIAAVAARNHRVTVPALAGGRTEAVAPTGTVGSPDAGDPPRPRPAVATLRRLVRVEALLLVLVFAVTGALSTSQPAIAIPPGPEVARADVGPLRAVVTTSPARVGSNAVRIELTEKATGRPFTGAKAVDLAEDLPGREVAALGQTATASPAEPGVFTVEGAPLTVAATWRFSLTVRVSEFDQYDARFPVRIRP